MTSKSDETPQGQELIVQTTAKEPEIWSAPTIFEQARWDAVERVAARMAYASLLPDHVKGSDFKNTQANCFMIANQAMQWNCDPYMLAQSCYFVHGRLGFEGKTINAILEATLRLKLKVTYTGDDRSDDLQIRIEHPSAAEKYIEGAVKDWKTTKAGSPWQPHSFRRMLLYRGMREWARMWAPGIMAGVYSLDELEAMSLESRAQSAKPVATGLIGRLKSNQAPGFNEEHVKEVVSEAGVTPTQATAAEKPQEEAVAEQVAADDGSPASAGAAAGSETGADVPPANADPASVVLEFSKSLSRAGTKKALGEVRDAHWKEHQAPKDEQSLRALKRVYELHEQRVKGTIAPEAFAREVETLVDFLKAG